MSAASAEIVNPVPADADGLANVLSFITSPGTGPLLSLPSSFPARANTTVSN